MIECDACIEGAAAAGRIEACCMRREVLPSAVVFAEIAQSVGLPREDVTRLGEAVCSLGLGWSARVMAASETADGASGLYFFQSVASKEPAPVVAVFRNAEGYLALIWSFFVWLESDTHEVIRCRGLDALIDAVRGVISEYAGIDDNELAADVPSGGARVGAAGFPSLDNARAGAFFPTIG